MSELEIIKITKEPITKESLNIIFSSIGLNTSDIVLVHSSMSALGWVCGGLQTIVDALIDFVGNEGTIIMPAHSGDWSDPKEWENPPVPSDWIDVIRNTMPPFDPLKTPTRGIGRLPEYFRTYPRVDRSNHPNTSFSGYGLHSKEILDNHPLSPQFGIDSPLGKLYKLNAKVLLLGSGFDSNTSFHLCETMDASRKLKKYGSPIIENGNRVWKWFDDYDYDSEDFERIGHEFIATGNVNTLKLNNGTAHLFLIKNAVDFGVRWMKENRHV
jgi:aminoglycoside 3-N-acetyltransferase